MNGLWKPVLGIFGIGIMIGLAVGFWIGRM